MRAIILIMRAIMDFAIMGAKSIIALGAIIRATVDRGPIEIRDLEGTHRFCHFLLSKLMCNGHLLNVSIPKSEKIQVRFSRSRFL